MTISAIIPGFGHDRELAMSQAERIRAGFGGCPETEVLVVDGENVGIARNDGLRRATGDWIVWVDADDELTDDWFAFCRDIGKWSADIVVWDYEFFGVGKRYLAHWDERSPTPGKLLSEVLRDGWVGGHLWRMAFRRQLWDGLAFDEGCSRYEDYLLLPKVISRARTVACVGRTLYRYVQRPNSASSATPDGIRDAERAAWRRADEWADTEFADDALLGAVRLAYGELAERVRSGVGFDDSAIASRKRIAASFWRLMKSRHASARDRVKFLIAITGWWWIQHWSWKRRGVA